MIDRGIVTIENGRITAKPPLDQTIASKGRCTTITEEKFYEEMARKSSATVPRLKAFAGQLEAIGIAIDSVKVTMTPSMATGRDGMESRIDFHFRNSLDGCGQLEAEYRRTPQS